MSEPESPPTKISAAYILKQLERIRPTADAQAVETDVPDTRALEGEDDLNIAGHEWLKQEIHRTGQLHYARLFLLIALFILIVIWLVSIGGLLLLVGFRDRTGFDLSDAIVIAYMTTTTVSVLGLFHIAAKWLFSASFSDLSQWMLELRKKR
jgi:hypothetical protein